MAHKVTPPFPACSEQYSKAGSIVIDIFAKTMQSNSMRLIVVQALFRFLHFGPHRPVVWIYDHHTQANAF